MSGGLFDRLSRKKFYGDKAPDGSPLIWPGTAEGFPVRYDPRFGVPQFRGEEYDNIPIRLDYDCGWFDMTDADDLKRWKEINDRIASGLYVKRNRIDLKDEAAGTLKVFLEWLIVTGDPTQKG